MRTILIALSVVLLSGLTLAGDNLFEEKPGSGAHADTKDAFVTLKAKQARAKYEGAMKLAKENYKRDLAGARFAADKAGDKEEVARIDAELAGMEEPAPKTAQDNKPGSEYLTPGELYDKMPKIIPAAAESWNAADALRAETALNNAVVGQKVMVAGKLYGSPSQAYSPEKGIWSVMFRFREHGPLGSAATGNISVVMTITGREDSVMPLVNQMQKRGAIVRVTGTIRRVGVSQSTPSGEIYLQQPTVDGVDVPAINPPPGNGQP